MRRSRDESASRSSARRYVVCSDRDIRGRLLDTDVGEILYT